MLTSPLVLLQYMLPLLWTPFWALTTSVKVPAGARAGVIGTLFPSVAPWLASAGIAPVSFTQKKQAALRWRTAQARSAVDRSQREIQALQARYAPGFLSDVQEQARVARIAELRKEAGLAESRIILLKEKQRSLGLPSRRGMYGDLARFAETFLAGEERSARVLLSLLSKQRDPWDLIRQDTVSLLRLGRNTTLVAGYARLRDMPRLAPHAAAIAGRISLLERYAPGILLAVDGHLDAVEPHLDQILDRLDSIEPHLPFVLQHLDVLAPHCGALIKHVDALLLYADDGGKYLELLLPYVPLFAPQLDALGPHLALLRPHMRRMLPHMPVIAPSAHRFASQLTVSVNADVLLFYFGWVLRIPRLGGWVLRLPFLPRLAGGRSALSPLCLVGGLPLLRPKQVRLPSPLCLAALLCKWLPSRPVRGRTCDYICDWEGCDIDAFTTEQAARASAEYCADTWRDSFSDKRRRLRATTAVLRRMKQART